MNYRRRKYHCNIFKSEKKKEIKKEIKKKKKKKKKLNASFIIMLSDKAYTVRSTPIHSDNIGISNLVDLTLNKKVNNS